MSLPCLENAGIVVEDLAACGGVPSTSDSRLGETPVPGDWVERVVGLEGVRVDVAMLETPDGSS